MKHEPLIDVQVLLGKIVEKIDRAIQIIRRSRASGSHHEELDAQLAQLLADKTLIRSIMRKPIA